MAEPAVLNRAGANAAVIAARIADDDDFARQLRDHTTEALGQYGIEIDVLVAEVQGVPFSPDPLHPEPVGPDPRCAANSLVPLPVRPEH
jgi:hypothetical protein